MSDFRIVDDSFRSKVRRPEYDAIERGQTVFVPVNGVKPGVVSARIRTAINQRGHKNIRVRIREVDGVMGVIAWLEEQS